MTQKQGKTRKHATTTIITAIHRFAIWRRLNDANPRSPESASANPERDKRNWMRTREGFRFALFVDGNYGPFVCVCSASRRRAKSICRRSGENAMARGVAGGKSCVHEKRDAVFPEIFRMGWID